MIASGTGLGMKGLRRGGHRGVSSADAGTGTSNPALAEGGAISHHDGVVGGDDLLPDVHGWAGAVAHVEIVRVS